MAFAISAGQGLALAGGASLLSGFLGSNAASKASDQQAQSGRESNALLKQQYDQTRADNAGVRFRGNAAGSRLSYLMGINGPPVGSNAGSNNLSGGMSTTGSSATAQLQAYLDRVNADTADLSNNSPSAEKDAALERNRLEVERVTGQMATAQQQDDQAQKQVDQAQANDPAFGSLSRNFSAGDMSSDPQYAQLQPLIDRAMQNSMNGPGTFAESPGYQFRMAEGLKATGNNQNAANGSYSGATLKALARFGQDTASQEYGNWQAQNNTNRNFQNQDRNFIAGQGQDAFNRFTGNQDRTYNRLAGIAGSGQTATNNVNSAGAAYAQNAGNTLQGIGNAQASGTVGSANAYTNAAQNGFNNYQQNSLMNMYRNNSSLYAPPVQDGGYGVGQGSAYGGNRQGM